ncbi:hypothetical protein AJ80_01791 [Polytolypa hystricis UAMH7299]|uniref:Secreted protein n=1 Tax=Polytolypa hystricis (strain UAMH7299) TaxID=1447883 RepID=A0A2B7Z0X5_POLH7|nr:hypothetical protein AJ80_01791 [Polytolypa hystricis UAMH7299]
MMLPTLSSTLLVLLGAAATSRAVAIDTTNTADLAARDGPTDLLEGYEVVGELTWIGSVEEGGPEYTFTGNAESILKEILALNPNYAPALEDPPPAENSTNVLAERSKGNIYCNFGGNGEIEVGRIEKEERYLRSLGTSKCHVGAGPGKCVRVSCSYNAGVWLCNDNKYAVSPRCTSLADYVRNIINRCQRHLYAPCWWNEGKTCTTVDEWRVRGQQFDSDGYNVIIGSSKC